MPPEHNGPRVIGHRGARALEPENTLRSFVRAQLTGADEVELDLRVTADGQLVVLHDATVDRTTNGHGELASFSLVEARELDAGDGERIPTFAEVLDAVMLPVQAEVKELAAIEPLVALSRERSLAGRVTVASFDPVIVSALASELPQLRRGLIMPDAPPDAVARAQAVDASLLCLGIASLGPELMAACRAASITVDAWPVNDPSALHRAVELRVEAITTDHPNRIAGW
jgi:glycerophosphoryl diester phosphodiesterase